MKIKYSMNTSYPLGNNFYLHLIDEEDLSIYGTVTYLTIVLVVCDGNVISPGPIKKKSILFLIFYAWLSNPIVNQIVVSIASGPWDTLFGGGNLPDFVAEAIAAMASIVVALTESQYHLHLHLRAPL